MTDYYTCKKCGWVGTDIERWEDWPADEFVVKCPECHAIDENILVCVNGEWVPAVKPYEPTPEEALRAELRYKSFAALMAANNIFRESVIKKEDE